MTATRFCFPSFAVVVAVLRSWSLFGGSHQMSTRSARGRWLARFVRIKTEESIISSLERERLQVCKSRRSRWGRQTGATEADDEVNVESEAVVPW